MEKIKKVSKYKVNFNDIFLRILKERINNKEKITIDILGKERIGMSNLAMGVCRNAKDN